MRLRMPATVRRVGALLGVLALTVAAMLPPDVPVAGRPEALRLALMAGATLPLLLCRRYPLVAFLMISLALAVYNGLGYPATLGWIAFGIGSYTVAARWPPRVSFAVAAGAVCLSLGAPMLTGRSVNGDTLFLGLILTALPTLLGDRVLARRQAAARAGAAERERLARELHDSVAHALSVIVVQADAAQAQLGRDETRVRAALAAIRRTGAASLGEMRQLVGTLREPAARAPLPGVRDIAALVSDLRASGVEADLLVHGTPAALPPLVDHSAYRIVQEALTNVRRHAQARHTRVVLACEPGQLLVEVTDDGVATPGPRSGGHGLAGMGERARLCGGVLEAGAAGGGGFRVTARLPLGQRS